MVVFVTSSPFVDGADRAILNPENELVDRLLAVLPPEPQVLVVASNPADAEGAQGFADSVAEAFAEAGMEFGDLAVLTEETAEDAGELAEQCDFILFAPGHVPTQNDFINALGLAELLEGFDGVVMGISAGAMNLAETVYCQPEEPGESDPDFIRFRPGVGVTEFQILPHYQKVKDNILDGLRLYEDVTYADSAGHSFLVLPDGSYIYEDEEECTLLGKAWRLQDGILELLTLEGEQLDLTEIF